MVKSGDTFWDISREYKVNLRQLAKWNGMAPKDMLRPGKTLVVWVDNVSNGHVRCSDAHTDLHSPQWRFPCPYCGKFNVKVSDLQKWNQAKA